MDLVRLDHIPTVKVAMTPFPHAVEIDAPISVARAMMSEHGVHQLPVTEAGRLAGVVSDRDVELVTASARGRPLAARVRDACTPWVHVVEDGERLDRVLDRMASEHMAAALVVRRGKLVGIFTFTDACRLFAEWLRARFPDPRGDDAA
jgi:acetoin utilization protein AcuB